MVFINNSTNVTLTPQNSYIEETMILTSTMPTTMNFEQAMRKNNIYQGNGLICQQAMCSDLGASRPGAPCPNECQNLPEWSKIVSFCGPNNSPSVDINGQTWVYQSANERPQAYAAALQSTGLQQLPTPYNVQGMY